MEVKRKRTSLSEDEVKVLAEFGGLCEVAIVRAGVGARSTSPGEGGWSAVINGFPLRSARKNERVFASVDTAIDTLVALGVGSGVEVKVKLEKRREDQAGIRKNRAKPSKK